MEPDEKFMLLKKNNAITLAGLKRQLEANKGRRGTSVTAVCNNGFRIWMNG